MVNVGARFLFLIILLLLPVVGPADVSAQEASPPASRPAPEQAATVDRLVKLARIYLAQENGGGTSAMIDQILALQPDNEWVQGMDPFVKAGIAHAREKEPQKWQAEFNLARVRGTQNLDWSHENQAARDVLQKWIPEINFKEIAFADALDFLHDVTDAAILPDWKAMKAAGVDRETPVTVNRLHEVKLYSALDVLLREASQGRLSCWIDEGVINISTMDELKKQSNRVDVRNQPADPKSELAVSALLKRRFPDINLKQISLADTINFLSDMMGANIVVYWKPIEAAGILRSAPVSLNPHDIEFSKVLEMTLQAAGGKKLDYRVRDNIIVVSTVDDLAKMSPTTQISPP